MNNDMISRRLVIGALQSFTGLTWEYLKKIYPMLNAIEEVPSAGPPTHACWECNCPKMDRSSAQPNPHEIGHSECAAALVKMWLDNVLTDGEYKRIIAKLNAYWAERRNNET